MQFLIDLIRLFFKKLLKIFLSHSSLLSASIERKQAISEEQNVYEKIQGMYARTKPSELYSKYIFPLSPPYFLSIIDLPTLLGHLSLEKYETNFAEEEVRYL